MRIKGLAAVAAISLITAPVLAARPTADSLSLVQAQRAGVEGENASELVGTTAWILAAVALGLIIWGVIELSGGDDGPSSP